MKRINTLLMVAIVLLAACSGKEEKTAGEIKLVNTKEFSEIISQDVLLVDVRTAGEYDAGFIEGAVNIDYKQADFEKRMGYFDRSTPVAVYCAKGGRSAAAAEKLKALGFETVYDLEGGYTQWVAK